MSNAGPSPPPPPPPPPPAAPSGLVVLNVKPLNKHGRRIQAEAVSRAVQELAWVEVQDDASAKDDDVVDDDSSGGQRLSSSSSSSTAAARKKKKKKKKQAGVKWSLAWVDVAGSEFYRAMRPHQRVNHVPRIEELTRKRRLAHHLNAMERLTRGAGDEYAFFPRSFVLPQDGLKLRQYAAADGAGDGREAWFIVKPDACCEGNGIYLVARSGLDALLARDEAVVCQRYIERPLLVERRKFDMRIYLLITSVQPLTLYLYNEGLARFCTEDYRRPDAARPSTHTVMFGHLTNYALNARNPRNGGADDGKAAGANDDEDDEGEEAQDGVHEGPAYKWRLTRLLAHLEREHPDLGLSPPVVWARIADMLVKMLIAVAPTLAHAYRLHFPRDTYGGHTFQLLGCDVMLDAAGRASLLECNRNPSLKCGAPLDADIKTKLVRDTLSLLDFRSYFDKSLLSAGAGRINKGRAGGGPPLSFQARKAAQLADQQRHSAERQRYEDVAVGATGFRRIFPPVVVDDDGDDAAVRQQAARPDAIVVSAATARRYDELLDLAGRVVAPH